MSACLLGTVPFSVLIPKRGSLQKMPTSIMPNFMSEIKKNTVVLMISHSKLCAGELGQCTLSTKAQTYLWRTWLLPQGSLWEGEPCSLCGQELLWWFYLEPWYHTARNGKFHSDSSFSNWDHVCSWKWEAKQKHVFTLEGQNTIFRGLLNLPTLFSKLYLLRSLDSVALLSPCVKAPCKVD